MANENKYTEVKSISGKPLADIKARNLYYYDCEEINITSKDCFKTNNNEDGTCTITGFYPNIFKTLYPNLVDNDNNIQKIVIPVRIRGYVVTKIDINNNPTSDYTNFLNIKEVVMPNSIIEFTSNVFIDAFNQSNNEILTSIHLSKNLTKLPNMAFKNCINLSNVELPESLIYIGNSAFHGCSNLFTNCNLKIPDNCKTIESYAFAKTNLIYVCSIDELYETNIISSVKNSNIKYQSRCLYLNHSQSISNNMFDSCADLRDVIIPNGIKYLSKLAFNNSSSNNLSVKYGSSGYISNLTIPSSVLDMNVYKYEYVNNNGTDVITKIDVSSEYDIKAENIYVEPNSYAEQWCKDNNKDYEYIYTLDGSNSNSNENLQYYENSSIIPTDTNYFTFIIDDERMTAAITKFDCYSNLTSVVIPYKYVLNDKEYIVTEIGVNAFYEEDDDDSTDYGNICKLKSIIIPNSVFAINDSAFYNCKSLTSVTIPDSVTYIGNGAFYECTSLTNITIPDSVTYIGYDAFDTISSNAKFYVEQGSDAEQWCKENDKTYMLSNVKPSYISNEYLHYTLIPFECTFKYRQSINIDEINNLPLEQLDTYKIGNINLNELGIDDLSDFYINGRSYYSHGNDSTFQQIHKQILPNSCNLMEVYHNSVSYNLYIGISITGDIYAMQYNTATDIIASNYCQLELIKNKELTITLKNQ